MPGVDVEGGRPLYCACHGSQYDPKDGAKVVGGPAPRRLAMLPLRIEEAVVVARGRPVHWPVGAAKRRGRWRTNRKGVTRLEPRKERRAAIAARAGNHGDSGRGGRPGWPLSLLRQGASADTAEGTIEHIDQVGNTFSVGGKTFQWSSMNSIGPDLHDLNAGDEVKINYLPTGSGRNTVQRITLVKAAAAAAPTAAEYRPVSDDRLVNPEPENWLHAARQLPGLDVQPAGSDQHHQRQEPGAGLELLDRRRFRPRGAADRQRRRHVRRRAVRQVLALDAKTGDLIWEYQRELPEGFGALHNTKRGIALYGDKVYMAGAGRGAGRARRRRPARSSGKASPSRTGKRATT